MRTGFSDRPRRLACWMRLGVLGASLSCAGPAKSVSAMPVASPEALDTIPADTTPRVTVGDTDVTLYGSRENASAVRLGRLQWFVHAYDQTHGSLPKSIDQIIPTLPEGSGRLIYDSWGRMVDTGGRTLTTSSGPRGRTASSKPRTTSQSQATEVDGSRAESNEERPSSTSRRSLPPVLSTRPLLTDPRRSHDATAVSIHSPVPPPPPT